MSIVINTNVPSLMAQSALNTSGLGLDKSLERLSTGLRINSASDDAAGLAIANRLESQVEGLNQAILNANDGISLAQTAEGALQESTNLLHRMRVLAVQSINDSNDSNSRQAIQLEVAQLQSELNRVASTTQFGTKNLLDGSFVNQNLQVGAFAGNTITFSIANASGTQLGNNAVSATGTISAAVLETVAGTPVANNNAAQTLTVSGNSGTATIAVSAGETAYAVASAVNSNTNTTGVTATASTTATLSALSASGVVSMKLDGVAVSASVTTSDMTNLMNAINNVSAQTGVTAAAGSSGPATLVLTDQTGKDITITNFADTGNANATMNMTGATGAAVTMLANTAANAGGTVGGTVSFNSTIGFTVTSTSATTLLNAASVTSSLSAVSSVNVSTSAGATSAIAVIDSALTQIDTIRANLGAIENRLSYTIENLADISNNESAAESRIRDADFAAETANLTRAQILQQAGTSILAQANSVPQMALKLLQ